MDKEPPCLKELILLWGCVTEGKQHRHKVCHRSAPKSYLFCKSKRRQSFPKIEKQVAEAFKTRKDHDQMGRTFFFSTSWVQDRNKSSCAISWFWNLSMTMEKKMREIKSNKHIKLCKEVDFLNRDTDIHFNAFRSLKSIVKKFVKDFITSFFVPYLKKDAD